MYPLAEDFIPYAVVWGCTRKPQCRGRFPSLSGVEPIPGMSGLQVLVLQRVP